MNPESEAKEDLLTTVNKLDRGIAYYQLIATTLVRAMYEVKRNDEQISYVIDPDILREMDVDHMTRDFIKLIRQEDFHAKDNSVSVVCSEPKEEVSGQGT